MTNYVYGTESFEKRAEKYKVVTSDIVRDVDVCVIGSGAAGAVLATKLAEAGKSVVLLEHGGYHDGESMNQRGKKEEREATPGDDRPPETPGDLPPTDEIDRLRRDLIRALDDDTLLEMGSHLRDGVPDRPQRRRRRRADRDRRALHEDDQRRSRRPLSDVACRRRSDQQQRIDDPGLLRPESHLLIAVQVDHGRFEIARPRDVDQLFALAQKVPRAG